MDSVLEIFRWIIHTAAWIGFIAKIAMNLKCSRVDSVATAPEGSRVSLMPGTELLLVGLLVASNPVSGSPIYRSKTILIFSLAAAIASYLPLLWRNWRR